MTITIKDDHFSKLEVTTIGKGYINLNTIYNPQSIVHQHDFSLPFTCTLYEAEMKALYDLLGEKLGLNVEESDNVETLATSWEAINAMHDTVIEVTMTSGAVVYGMVAYANSSHVSIERTTGRYIIPWTNVAHILTDL